MLTPYCVLEVMCRVAHTHIPLIHSDFVLKRSVQRLIAGLKTKRSITTLILLSDFLIYFLQDKNT